jgi:hypothetical protein
MSYLGYFFWASLGERVFKVCGRSWIFILMQYLSVSRYCQADRLPEHLILCLGVTAESNQSTFNQWILSIEYLHNVEMYPLSTRELPCNSRHGLLVMPGCSATLFAFGGRLKV